MTVKRWDVLIAAVLCAGLGIAAGFYAARQSGTEAGATAPAPSATPDEADHEHFTEETLRNLGVELGTLLGTTTSQHRFIVATVVETARTHQPVQAPIGGVIDSIAVEPGQVVPADSSIGRLVRQPIPLPELVMTAGLVAPDHDEIHTSIRDLRQANADLQIAQNELERIERFTESGEEAPVLPLQKRIDLEYAIERARVRVEVSHHELERHGFSHEQMEAVTAGEHIQLFDAPHVRRALLHAGLWTGNADRILAALPDDVAGLPIAVGAIAELVARGRATEALCAWLEASPDAGSHFLEVASLLLSGSGLDDVRRLHDLGALAPAFDVRAPSLAPDWDVERIHVRPGHRVETGQAIVDLRDARNLRLRLEPVGSEIADLEHAAAAGRPCRALPLLEGAGPVLENVRIDYVAADSADGRVRGWARLTNQPSSTTEAEDGVTYRTWSVQPGVRYRVAVPVRTVDGVYVLPRSAVTEDGPDRVVLVPVGDGGFEEVPIAILFEDEERIVLAADANPRLAPGVQIVMRGAFELGLAMHAGEVGADHGHSH